MTKRNANTTTNDALANEVNSRLREDGLTIYRIPADRLRAALARGDEFVTVKVPSACEVMLTRDEAIAVLATLTR